MNCKNCGAEYADVALKCPYCGTENHVAAEKEKKEILEDYDMEAQRLYRQAESFPQKAAKRITRNIIRVLAILAGAGFVITVLVLVWVKLSAGVELKVQKKHLQRMEEFYQMQDYEGLLDYMDKRDLYGRSYDKYSQVARAAKYYCWMQEQMSGMEEILEDKDISSSQRQEFASQKQDNVLYYASHVLSLCGDNMEDTVYLGNEAVLSQFYEECVLRLKELGYDEEQIEILRQWDRRGNAGDLW